MRLREDTNGHRDAGLLERAREEGKFFWSEVVEIRSDLQELAAKELELLRAEITEQVTRLRTATLFGAIAAIHVIVLAIFIFVSVMLGLAEVLPIWAAALITTGIIATLTAIVSALAYAQIKAFSVTPTRTINSLKEDAEWARSQLKSNRKSGTSEKPSPTR